MNNIKFIKTEIKIIIIIRKMELVQLGFVLAMKRVNFKKHINVFEQLTHIHTAADPGIFQGRCKI